MYCDRNSNDKTKMWKSLFLWGFLLIALMATVAAGASAATSQPAQMIDKFEVEEDFGVRKALAMLGSQCQKNIVPSPNVDGVLAFRALRNVTFEEAMDAILGENFRYEQAGQLIKVYTKDEYQKLKDDPARKVHEVFTLYYITAEEASKLIMPVLSGDAVVQASTASEKTISGGSGGGSSGGSSSGGGGGSLGSGGGGDSMALNDKIVVYDFPEKIEMAREVIKSLDIKPKQVLVEATILSALLTENMDFGIDWNLLSGIHVTDFPANLVGGRGTPIETFAFAEDPAGAYGLTAGFSADNVQAIITALETVTDVTVLANPKILALNKQEGSVLIGRKLGYRESTSISAAGTETKGSVKFLPTGTQLVFRPYIGNDGYIRMDIYPKDSTAEPDDDGVPQETTTELQTNILVKDGETVVIGGLFRDVVNTTRSQVPILGDIPFVGGLFRGTTDTTQRQEVIVLLTPHIIEEPSETEGAARAADISRKLSGAKEGLQWMDRARLAEDSYARAVSYYSENDNVSAMKQLSVALNLRPTYLEAIRLKERIIAESSPEEVQKLERIMLQAVDQEEAPNWRRR
jgi:type IV pilus assembly protein PilQ